MRLKAKWALAQSQDVSYRSATPNGCSRARFETDTPGQELSSVNRLDTLTLSRRSTSDLVVQVY